MRELRTFLRHGAEVHELGESHPVLAGRGEACDVVLDDSLASREHARFEVVGDSVYVVDLESRNGALVNGTAVRGRRELHHGDIVTVGQTPLLLLRQAREPRAPAPSERPRRMRRTSEGEMTSQGSVFEILAGGARLSLEDGDISGAERSALNLQVQLRRGLARDQPVEPGVFDECLGLLVDLSDRAADPVWLERALELCVHAEQPAPRSITQRLVEVASRVGAPRRHVAEYLALRGLEPEAVELLRDQLL